MIALLLIKQLNLDLNPVNYMFTPLDSNYITEYNRSSSEANLW